MEQPKTITFNGVEYRLMGAGRYYLSQSTSNEGRKHAKGLHVAIWEYYNGQEVPDGYEIHHKDGDTFNNDISNLECVSHGEHRKLHPVKDMEKQKEHLERIRPLAAEWHKSEEGHEWHVQHAKKTIQNVPRKQHTCIVCGKQFDTRF